MLFNSVEFAVFASAVFVLYWFALDGKRGRQNVLLLGASYVFYGWWDWRFLGLILVSSAVDYLVGRALGRYHDVSRRKLLLVVSIVANIGMLGFFKYFDFFASSFEAARPGWGSASTPLRSTSYSR